MGSKRASSTRAIVTPPAARSTANTANTESKGTRPSCDFLQHTQFKHIWNIALVFGSLLCSLYLPSENAPNELAVFCILIKFESDFMLTFQRCHFEWFEYKAYVPTIPSVLQNSRDLERVCICPMNVCRCVCECIPFYNHLSSNIFASEEHHITTSHLRRSSFFVWFGSHNFALFITKKQL